MVEAMLKDFNYNDMEHMQIDSDDDATPKQGCKVPKDLAIDSDEDEVSI